MLDINRQKMFYAKQIGQVPVYDTDEDGNLKYITVDGNNVPIETGEYTMGYDVPVPFYSSISNKLSESLIKEFGVDNSTNFVQIVDDNKRQSEEILTVIQFQNFVLLFVFVQKLIDIILFAEDE